MLCAAYFGAHRHQLNQQSAPSLCGDNVSGSRRHAAQTRGHVARRKCVRRCVQSLDANAHVVHAETRALSHSHRHAHNYQQWLAAAPPLRHASASRRPFPPRHDQSPSTDGSIFFSRAGHLAWSPGPRPWAPWQRLRGPQCMLATAKAVASIIIILFLGPARAFVAHGAHLRASHRAPRSCGDLSPRALTRALNLAAMADTPSKTSRVVIGIEALARCEPVMHLSVCVCVCASVFVNSHVTARYPVPGNGCTPIRQCNWYSWLQTSLESRGVQVCF